ERPASREDAQPSEQLLRARLEQVVAPVEGHAKRLLVLRRVAPAARQQRQTVREAREQRRRGEELRTSGRQLDRQRQALEAHAQLGDRRGVLLAEVEVRIGRLRAADEQLRRFLVDERRHCELPLGGDTERRAARDEDRQLRSGVEQTGDTCRGRKDLLEVVDEQQQLGGAQAGLELLVQRPACALVDRERIGLAARAVERQHQLAAGPLAERLLGDEPLELADELHVTAESELGVDAVLLRRQAQLLQPQRLELRQIG